MLTIQPLIVIDVVGLTPSHMENQELTPNLNRLANQGVLSTIRPTFPAVTGTVQATYLTGFEPCRHGIVANGMFDRKTHTVTMWEQTGCKLSGRPIWELLKSYRPNATTAVLFWQFIKYASADILLTPSPVHLAKGMHIRCFSKPHGWYEQVASHLGPFPLQHFWGPMASLPSSEWILAATLDTLKTLSPDLTLTYLPQLDFNAQRFGPDSQQALQAVKELDFLLGKFSEKLWTACSKASLVILSEYAIRPVNHPVAINQLLRKEGFLKVFAANGSEYVDFYHSPAFAVSDHQIAHIYCKESVAAPVKKLLAATPGVDEVFGLMGKKDYRIDHPQAGELVAVAAKDTWFSYDWWLEESQAPEYARTVDIHQKPGYDPCELFWDHSSNTIPLRPDLIRGSHGRPPANEEDLVSLLAVGPGSGAVGSKKVWEARDICTLLLQMMGVEDE